MRGNFGNYDVSVFVESGKPRRNCATTMIAPTGTISLVADCSSGIEPVFSLVSLRRTFFEDDSQNRPTKELEMIDPVFKEYLETVVKSKKEREKVLNQVAVEGTVKRVKVLPVKLRRVLVTAHEIGWRWHVKMQAAWQKHFDNSVSKTINLPRSAKIEEVKKAFKLAWELGCKGITIYRDGSRNDQVLVKGFKKERENKEDCLECGKELEMKEGCSSCSQCGFSKCDL